MENVRSTVTLVYQVVGQRLDSDDKAKTLFLGSFTQMNLASRCREAITHVAMLKKELATILNNPTLYQVDSIPFVTEKDTAVKLQLIKKSLIKQGLYDSTIQANDSTKLARALNKLQKKWFIQPDGKIGKYTTQAFSYNREKIIKQIDYIRLSLNLG